MNSFIINNTSIKNKKEFSQKESQCINVKKKKKDSPMHHFQIILGNKNHNFKWIINISGYCKTWWCQALQKSTNKNPTSFVLQHKNNNQSTFCVINSQLKNAHASHAWKLIIPVHSHRKQEVHWLTMTGFQSLLFIWAKAGYLHIF